MVMSNPTWFSTEATHKAVYIGPARLPVALCKIVFREYWPAEGCADPSDKTRRKWEDVGCIQCRAMDPSVGKRPKRKVRRG